MATLRECIISGMIWDKEIVRIVLDDGLSRITKAELLQDEYEGEITWIESELAVCDGKTRSVLVLHMEGTSE